MTKWFRVAPLFVVLFAFTAFASAGGCNSDSPDESLGASRQADSISDGSADVTTSAAAANNASDGTVTSSCRAITLRASLFYGHDADPQEDQDTRYFAQPFAVVVPASVTLRSGTANNANAFLVVHTPDGRRVNCTYDGLGQTFTLDACDDESNAGATLFASGLTLLVPWGDTTDPSGKTVVEVTLNDGGVACEGGAQNPSTDAGSDASTCGQVELIAVQSNVPKAQSDSTFRALDAPLTFAIPSSLAVLPGGTTVQHSFLDYWTGDGAHSTCAYRRDATTRTTGTAPFDYCFDGTTAGTVVTADHFSISITDSKSPTFSAVDVVLSNLAGSCTAADGGVDASNSPDASDSAPEAGASDAVIDAAADAAPDATPSCTPAQCDDQNPCTTDACSTSGTCTHSPVAAGSSCSDGNACNGSETCSVAGTCASSAAPVVDDGNACTADSCTPTGGVAHTPVAAGTSCSDGNACNGAETCSAAGICAAGTAPVVDDGNPCTADSCTPTGGVVHTPVAAGNSCSDGNACNGSETCTAAGSCASGTAPVIDDGNPCTADSCTPTGGVVHTPVAAGTSCSDGNACNGVEACSAAGACTAGAPPVTDDSNPCTMDSCDPVRGVVHTPVATGTVCGAASNRCVAASTCTAAAQCVAGGALPVDDGNPCTIDACDAATGVSHAPATAGTTCGSAANACVGSLACNGAGACSQGAPPLLDDGNPCTADSCDPALGVVHVPLALGATCGPGDACTAVSTCDATAKCNAGAAIPVDDNNVCTTDSCDPATGQHHAPVAAGTACGDNSNRCSTTHACNVGGTCIDTPPPVTDDGNTCTTDACNPATGAVAHTPLSGCDPSPTTEGPIETRASLTGQVIVSGASAATGYTVSVFDGVATGTPRSDAVVTMSADGTFRVRLAQFPDSEPTNVPAHHLVVHIESPDFLPIVRATDVRPGDVTSLGVITAKARDPQVTMIDGTGGKATDSKGLVEVNIPAGALAAPTAVRITPMQLREELPGVLPPATITTYAFEMEPDGTTFTQPITVRIANTRNLPTTLQIPVGSLDRTTNEWRHEGLAVWDGQKFAFTATHFSAWDVNAPDGSVEVATVTDGSHKEGGGDGRCELGSSVGLASGAVRQTLDLPTYHRMNRDYGVALSYDSFLTMGATQSPPVGTGSHPPPRVTYSMSTGVNVTLQCVSRKAADNIVSTTPGSCIAGSCGAGSLLIIPPSYQTHSRTDTNPDVLVTTDQAPGATDFESDIPIDLSLPGSSTVRQSGYYPVTTTFTSGAGTCAGGGGAFGPSETTQPATTYLPATATGPQPIATYSRHVFVHHRHAAAAGSGWDIANVDRLYKNPHADEAVLVRGNGDQEYFYPRATVKQLQPTHGLDSVRALARELSTGTIFVASQATSTIASVDPTTGVQTTVASGAGFDSPPLNMAVTTVGGVRHFLIATATRLIDLPQGGTPRTLIASSYVFEGQDQYLWIVPGIAARNNIAIYGDGNGKNPVLYRFDLNDAAPQAIAISRGADTALPVADISLTPYNRAVSTYKFADPHGLAFSSTGTLYVADRRRNAVYALSPDANGEISGSSLVTRVLGDGAGRMIAPIGHRDPAKLFSVNQPSLVEVGTDGNLWIIAPYGAAIWDVQRDEARWVLFDQTLRQSELTLTLFTSPGNRGATYMPVGPTQLIGDDTKEVVLVSVDLFSSETDPTRSLTFDVNDNATLVDTTRDVQEAYARASQATGGQLLERRTRENEPIVSFAYADATSDLVTSMTDPTGGVTSFTYSGGKLQTIVDPAGRSTTLEIDARGDLVTITEPESTIYKFEYLNHRMTKKTSPEGDVTSYVYDSVGGFVTTTVRPAGESYSNIKPAYSQTPSRDASGKTSYSGSYTDPRGVAHAYTIDDRGRVLTESYTADGVPYKVDNVRQTLVGAGAALGDQRSNAHLGRVLMTRVNGLGVTNVVGYDEKGRVATRGFNVVQETYSYDPNGRVSSFYKGPGNHYFAVERDPAGHPTRVYEATGGVATGREQRMTWRPDGLVGTLTDHGVTTTLNYFDGGDRNLQSTSDTVGRTSSFTYDAAGNLQTRAFGSGTNDGSTHWSFESDGLGRLTKATDADGNVTTLGYERTGCGCSDRDLLNRVHTPDVVAGQDWVLGYGVEGRLYSVTDPLNHTETYDYEPMGERKRITDANNHTMTMTHDALGRLLGTIDPLQRARRRTYPVPGTAGYAGQAVASASASATPATTGITAALQNGDYQLGSNLYDFQDHGSGDVRSREWASVEFYRDATIQISYGQAIDDAGRVTDHEDRTGLALTTPTVLNSGSNATGQYAQLVTGVNGSLPDAPPTSLEANTATGYESSSFGYSTDYDLTHAVGTWGGTGGTQAVHDYLRDAAGRLLQTTVTYNYVGSLKTSFAYGYHPTGALASDHVGSITYNTRGLVATRGDYRYDAYDALGRNTSMVFPDGHKRTQNFDALGRITQRCYIYGGAIADRCYGAIYDGVGNPTQLTDPEGTDDITYDELDRVRTVARTPRSGATPTAQTYEYNALGALKTNAGVALDHQRPALTGGGVADAAVPKTFNGLPITLDPAGRITSAAGTPLEYSRSGYVSRVNGGAAIARDAFFNPVWSGQATGPFFAYDSAGNRVKALNLHQSAATPPVASWDEDTWDFEGVDRPLHFKPFKTVTGPSTEFYFEIDLAGNVRRLRGIHGEDYGGYRYSAFGELYPSDSATPAVNTATVANDLMWKGRPRVGSYRGVELYDVRARWWAPQLGAFVSVDGFGYSEPRSTLWGWSGQNPLRWSDPSGHGPDDPAYWEKFQAAYETAEKQDPEGTHAIAAVGAAAGLLGMGGSLAAVGYEGLGALGAAGNWLSAVLGVGAGTGAVALEEEAGEVCPAGANLAVRTGIVAGQATGGGGGPIATIQFGNNANQLYHAFRHIDEMGLDRGDVISAIEAHLPTVASQLQPGEPLNQVITVNGEQIQYTAYMLANGVVNVGRIHGVP